MAEHSVFGSGVPAGTLTIHGDAAPEAVTAHQFLNAGSTDFEIVRLRWLVPAGSGAPIGSLRSGFVGLMLRDDVAGPVEWPNAVANDMPTNGWSAFTQTIVEGWNEFELDAPVTLPVGEWVIAGINVEGWYAYSTNVTQPAIPAVDGSGLTLVGASNVDGDPHRTFYDSDYVSSHSFSASASRWFGVDLVVTADAAPPGSGEAASAYTFGAATASGSAPALESRSGQATGGYAFAGSSIGVAPTLPVRSGTALGGYEFGGTAVGVRHPRGSAAGAFAFNGTATGPRPDGEPWLYLGDTPLTLRLGDATLTLG